MAAPTAVAQTPVAAAHGAVQPPEQIEVDGLRWIRTEVASGRDLVNGKAWIEDFQGRCTAAAASQSNGQPRRRQLRAVVSCGDEPQYWASSGGALPNPLRNRVLEEMAANGLPRPGRHEKLLNGEEVIFWFNVGPTADVGPPVDRVFVTGARCPHQGVCLDQGELREIEDLAGGRRPVVRCPRHNRLFDVTTGKGEGNFDTLPTYQARFFREFGRFYVAVGAASPPQGGVAFGQASLAQAVGMPAMGMLSATLEAPQSPDGGPVCAAGDDCMDVDSVAEPSPKRQRPELPTPARSLMPQWTIS